MPLDIARLRRETAGCAEFIHFDSAGAALMPDRVHATVVDHIALVLAIVSSAILMVTMAGARDHLSTTRQRAFGGGVALDVADADRGEAGRGEHLKRKFSAPHGAEPFGNPRQRPLHAELRA